MKFRLIEKIVTLVIVCLLLGACGQGMQDWFNDRSGSSSASGSVFTTAMLSGKSFTTSDGVITFNADGTLSGAGANLHGNQTWTINPAGQLVVTNTGKGTATFTLTSGDATNGWTGTITYSDGSPTSTGTLIPSINTPLFVGTWKGTNSSTGNWALIDFNANNTYRFYGGNTRTASMYEAGTYSYTGAYPDFIVNFVITDDQDGVNGSGNGNGTVSAIRGIFRDQNHIDFYKNNQINATLVKLSAPQPTQTSGFTTAMLSGKTFYDSNGGVVTFNSNGTFYRSTSSATNMTWSINSNGQILVVSGSGIVTATLTSGSLSTGLNYSVSNTDGTTNIGTLVLAIAPATSATTVVDPTTNLVWQKADDNNKRNWYEAITYCDNLTLNSYNDWRLPSKDELKALNYSSVFNQISGTYYAQINDQYIGSYWSNTSFDNSQAYHVFLRSNAGSEGYANKSFYFNLVRCVRP